MAVNVVEGSISSLRWNMSMPDGIGIARTPRAFIRVDLPHPGVREHERCQLAHPLFEVTHLSIFDGGVG